MAVPHSSQLGGVRSGFESPFVSLELKRSRVIIVLGALTTSQSVGEGQSFLYLVVSGPIIRHILRLGAPTFALNQPEVCSTSQASASSSDTSRFRTLSSRASALMPSLSIVMQKGHALAIV